MEQEAVSGVPARATQGTKARRRQWWWAEASIWTERMVSALVNGVKACPRAGRRPGPWGGKWFSLVDKVIRPTTLESAWRKVARNNGAAGVDGQSIERFAAQAERYLHELQVSLKDGSYQPDPVKRVEIPKACPCEGGGDGRTRPLGIPTVKSLPRAKAGDRIVQTALKMVIEPIPRVRPERVLGPAEGRTRGAGPRTCFETQFRPGSYGFRPGRSCKRCYGASGEDKA